ncbi:MAG: tetratricopeptide repeat protein [Alphaproteobacteria bacterium]|nr:tetratricopeptide repeat protein [Alphaproteobacteria bacterium]
MRLDRFDLPLTAMDGAAATDYAAAVDLLLSGNEGADVLLDRAIAADPDLALAHAAKARLLQVAARFEEARAAAAVAARLAPTLTPRERGHIDAVALAVGGRGSEALASAKAHLGRFPRDGLVLSLAVGVYGLIAMSGRCRHHAEQLDLLAGLAPSWGAHWWLQGFHGWALIETGRLAPGIDLVERALAAAPRFAHAAHARAHGFAEAGDAAGGAAFLASWLPGYARASQLHCHLNWHMALCALEQGDAARALALHDDAIAPAVARSAPMPTLADGASLLWRCALDGADVGARWDGAADLARRAFPGPSLAFADLHAAMAEAAIGDSAAAAARAAGLERLAAAGTLAAGPVAALLARGIAAYAAARWDEAAQALAAAVPELPRIGGSHAQRAVLEDTLIRAEQRAGRTEAAAARLRARLARRPSPRDERWLAGA